MLRGLIVGLLLALALGCGSKDDPVQATVTWPDKPGGGRPLVFEFVGFKGKDDKRSATIRVFNFSNKTVSRLILTLSYFSDKGFLKQFPWTMQGPSLVGPTQFAEQEMGAYFPHETTRVEVLLSEVEFSDGSSWP